MADLHVTVSGIADKPDHLLVGLQIKNEAWTRFATVKIPYDEFTPRHARMIISHCQRGVVYPELLDTPISSISEQLEFDVKASTVGGGAPGNPEQPE